jgi:hypothetical protein
LGATLKFKRFQSYFFSFRKLWVKPKVFWWQNNCKQRKGNRNSNESLQFRNYFLHFEKPNKSWKKNSSKMQKAVISSSTRKNWEKKFSEKFLVHFFFFFLFFYENIFYQIRPVDTFCWMFFCKTERFPKILLFDLNINHGKDVQK